MLIWLSRSYADLQCQGPVRAPGTAVSQPPSTHRTCTERSRRDPSQLPSAPDPPGAASTQLARPAVISLTRMITTAINSYQANHHDTMKISFALLTVGCAVEDGLHVRRQLPRPARPVQYVDQSADQSPVKTPSNSRSQPNSGKSGGTA